MDGTQVLILAGALLLLVLAVANLVWVVRRVVRRDKPQPLKPPTPGEAARPTATQPVPVPPRPEPASVPVPEPAAAPEPEPEPEPEQVEVPAAEPEESPPPPPPVADEPQPMSDTPAAPPPAEPAPAPPTHPAAQREAEQSRKPSGPAYTPASSVELRFEDDSMRIGVSEGTPTHAAFTDLANRLLAELPEDAEEAGLGDGDGP